MVTIGKSAWKTRPSSAGEGCACTRYCAGFGGVIEGIAAGRNVAQAFADNDQEIGAAHGRGELGIDVDAGVADERWMPVVDMVLTAERRDDGDVEGAANLAICSAASALHPPPPSSTSGRSAALSWP